MTGLASTILSIVFILGAAISLLYILYLLAREKGTMHAVLGFIFPPYPYIWGWIRAGSLQIIDVMIFWTFVSIGSVAFPLIMAAVSGPPMFSPTVGGEAVAVSGEVVSRGPVTRGSQVQGRIDDLFGVDEYTLAASSAETINLMVDPAPGSGADPRLKVLNSQGQVIASDDDSGGELSAMINNLRLPSAGSYRIQVDVWSPGAYVLRIE